MHIPRVGWEVLVDFIEGDPDRPVIIGAVYNGAHLPPYKLPDEKTKSTVKSDSSKGGGGFNEIRLEDAKGKEQIFIHGQQELAIRVEKKWLEWVGNDRHSIVGHDLMEKVKNDRHETVEGNHMEKIVGDRSLKVEGKEAIDITGTHSITVTGDVAEVFKANHSEDTTEQHFLKAKEIILNADDNITLKVGSSLLAIDKEGIKLGTSGQLVIECTGNVTVNAKGDVTMEATGNADLKGTGGLNLETDASANMKGATVSVKADSAASLEGAMTDVKGSGMVKVQGGIVKIN
ncbi:MAG TPA: type VI secretion system tip protein VgrG, partial [candidate division Zixibacteria bacterium]|nr:type VI secretion system tip protein VgrG [candidate division Zixibacteria bacterium]